MDTPNRDNGSRDQVPPVVQLKGDHRLDIDLKKRAIAIHPQVVVIVDLGGHADHGRKRIGQLFGQVVFGFLGPDRDRKESQRHEYDCTSFHSSPLKNQDCLSLAMRR